MKHPHTLTALLGILGVSAVALTPVSSQTRSEFVPTYSTNSRVKQQVERMQRLASQKLWDEWLTTYQALVDDESDLVLEKDEEFLIGVRHYCHQALGSLPAEVRQKYRQLHDGDAKRLYDKAAAAGDGAGMREVYSRYRFSSSAPRALLWVANRAQDEGRAELARVAYSRLAKDPAVPVNVLLRYALAADAAGKPAEAREALGRVRKEFAQAQVTLAGQGLTGAEAAGRVEKSLRPAAKAPGRSWPAFAGAGARMMSGAPTGGLQRLWEFEQSTSVGSGSTRQGYQTVVIGSSYSTPRARFSFLSFPVIQGDRMWVQGPRNVTAVNLADGKKIWDQQRLLLAKDEAPMENSNPRTGGVWYPSGRPVQGAPSLEGHLLAARVPLTLGEPDGGRWPADFSLSVFDARTGTELWRKLALGDPRGMYFNIPTLQASTIFTGIATYKGGITEYNAVALDAGTGEPLWNTYLGAGSDPLAVADGSPAVVHDGLVWIESTLYTLNALDLITGEVRLVYRYSPGRRFQYRGGFNSAPPMTNEPISVIAAAPGRVIFAPRWGTDVAAVETSTGRLVWSAPKAPNQSTAGWLIGADDKRAYVAGDHLQALSLTDGARDWTWEPDVSSNRTGYAALVGDRIYMPVEGKIHVRAAADGREIEVLDVTDVLGESPGLVALTAVDGLLLVSTRDKVIAFGPK